LAAFVNALTGSKPLWKSGVGLVVGIVLIWGLFINGTGAAFRDGYCWSAYPNTIDSHPSRVWDWSDPQFLRPYHDLADGRSIKSVVAGSCLAPTT
jgi:hypothetical protein